MSSDAATLEDRLLEFRSGHSLRHLEHGAQSWRYWCGGGSDDPVLWLTGALGIGEISGVLAVGTGARFRLLLPDYPPVSTVNDLADGLVAVLDREHVAAAHVVGASFGGMIAQSLVRRHPDRVRSLVLSHTATPSPSIVRLCVMRVASSLIPDRLLRLHVRRRLRPSFAVAGPSWARYFDDSLASLGRDDLVSRIRLIAEFLQQGFGPDDLSNWPGPILILGAEDDDQMARGSIEALKRCYPTARTHIFSGMGHSAPILAPDRYVAVVMAFLASHAT